MNAWTRTSGTEFADPSPTTHGSDAQGWGDVDKGLDPMWAATPLVPSIAREYLGKKDKDVNLISLRLFGSSGTSPSAKLRIAVIRHEMPGVTREALKKEVYGLLEEAGINDWDGEGALALSQDTVSIAQKLVDELPGYLGKPDITVTPQGEIDFDWAVSGDVMLTVSVGPLREIAFAGLFHGTRLNGREPWTGILPQFVDCCFERLRASLGS